jgi:hypothetical protein
VQLKISLKADVATLNRIKELVPSAKLKNGSCELTIEGEAPSEVAKAAKELLEKLREAVSPPKGFK